MKYIKTYENFTPIKINSAKPFKVKKNIDKNIKYLQRGISSIKKRLEKQRDVKKHSDMNNDLNSKIQKLKDLNFKKIKQQEYFRNNPVKENLDTEEKNLIDVLESPDFNPEDIVEYIGLDEKDYKVRSGSYYRYEPEYYKDSLTIYMNSRKLEDLMEIENGLYTIF